MAEAQYKEAIAIHSRLLAPRKKYIATQKIHRPLLLSAILYNFALRYLTPIIYVRHTAQRKRLTPLGNYRRESPDHQQIQSVRRIDWLHRLRHTIRSLIVSSTEETKDLLDLCIDVIYHDKMKAYGLRNLIEVYTEWKQ